MMCERLGFQWKVLDLGYSFFWSDMDTVWPQDATKSVPRGLDFVGVGDGEWFDRAEEEADNLCGCMTF